MTIVLIYPLVFSNYSYPSHHFALGYLDDFASYIKYWIDDFIQLIEVHCDWHFDYRKYCYLMVDCDAR